MTRMNLIVPPTCDLTVPLLGAYQLAGYAESKGFPFVVNDFNIEFCKVIVNYSINRAKNFVDVEQITDKQLDECAIAKFLSQYPHIDEYEVLLSNFKNCSNTQDYWILVDYLRACYDMYSLQFKGIRFRIDGFDSKYKWNLWSDIDSFISEYSVSPVMDALRQICSKTDLSPYAIIGISVTFESQLFLTLLICQILREINPNAKIIIGGGFINAFVDCAEAMGPIADYCDCVFAGEGEALIEFLSRRNTDLATVGKAAYINSAHFVVPQDICEKKLQVQPPRFTSAGLLEHFSPKRIVPMRFSYDCYWGKCKFCSDKENHECLDKEYNIKRMIDYCLGEVSAKNIDGIYFLDSAIKPNDIRAFATAIADAKLTVPWGTNLRFEKAFDDEALIKLMVKSGFVFAKFGLESGSQRLLDSMNKGTDIRVAANIVSKFRKYGVLVHTYVMLAYPGETQEDREKTEEFLLSEYSHPDNYNCSEFILYGGASIAKEYEHMLKKSNNTGDGWHSSEYGSFTNDDIQMFIASMRRKFDEKHNPQSVLMSTGHTIAYSNVFSKNNMQPVSGDYIALSSKVLYTHIGDMPCMLWWNRNRGCSYMAGEWVSLLNDCLNNGISAVGFEQIGIPESVSGKLWSDTCLRKKASGSDKIAIPQFSAEEFKIEQSNRLNSLGWYGQYDAN